MIHIVTWLLTRRCNLNCGYCDISNCRKDELKTGDVLDILVRLKHHNSDVFIIFMGGEPFLRKDLHEIIKFCNDISIKYTIISNSSPELQKEREKLFNFTEVSGYTASIDPNILDVKSTSHEYFKSKNGLKVLHEINGIVKDRVAEITISKNNIHNLYNLVKRLTCLDIISDITWLDVSKNKFYDFSKIKSYENLLNIQDVLSEMDKIFDDKYLKIHMKDELLPKIIKGLPSNLDCKIEKNIHNITIDSDGIVRLCLRISGKKIRPISYYLSKKGELSEILHYELIKNKRMLCRKCNWTCPEMSKLIDEESKNYKNLTHEQEN